MALPPHLWYTIYRDFCRLETFQYVAGLVSNDSGVRDEGEDVAKQNQVVRRALRRVVRDRLFQYKENVLQDKESHEFLQWVVDGLGDDAEEASTRRTSATSTAEQSSLSLEQGLFILQIFQDIVLPYQGTWPVWCGNITIESTSQAGTRVRSQARVLLTAPCRTTLTSPLYSRTPTASFRCEPYRMQCVPPYAYVHGLDDDEQLQPIWNRLDTWGQVAVPVLNQPTPLDVRVLTMAQVKRRQWLGRPPPSLDTATAMCFWHDDRLDELHHADYVQYLSQVYQVWERLHAQATVVKERHYQPATSRSRR